MARKTKFSYRYTDGTGKAILSCPECGHRWDAPEGITVTFRVGGCGSPESEVQTHLDPVGNLVDVGGVVASGHHCSTNCGGCGEMLVNIEGVNEIFNC